MRIAKNIFLILGILFVAINALAYIGGISPLPKEKTETTYKIAYFIGSNFFLIVGLIFIYVSYRFNKKINKRKDQKLVESLLKD